MEERKTVCHCEKIHLIGLDGGLRHVASSIIAQELQKKGYELVINPKRTYYPEKDQTNPHYKNSSFDALSSFDMLEVEVV